MGTLLYLLASDRTPGRWSPRPVVRARFASPTIPVGVAHGADWSFPRPPCSFVSPRQGVHMCTWARFTTIRLAVTASGVVANGIPPDRLRNPPSAPAGALERLPISRVVHRRQASLPPRRGVRGKRCLRGIGSDQTSPPGDGKDGPPRTGKADLFEGGAVANPGSRT